MSLDGQQLMRCPKCVAVLPRVATAEGLVTVLDPERNQCRNCGHVFPASAALPENYPKDGRRAQRRAISDLRPATAIPRTGELFK